MNKNCVKVELTKYEMEMACQVALRRQIDAEYAGMRDRVNSKTFSEGLRAHVLGCMGEVAVAKYAGLYWNGSIGTFTSAADLGLRAEVRHRSLQSWDLIVRESDKDDSIYILSTGDSRNIVIHGGIQGKDAKQSKWLQTHGGKSAAYFIPSDQLPITPRDLHTKYRD